MATLKGLPTVFALIFCLPPCVHAAEPIPLEKIQTGPNVSLGGNILFPSDDPWNRDISHDPVDPNSATLIAAMNPAKGLHPDFGPGRSGIPYIVVDGKQAKVNVQARYAGDSDPGPYPIPSDAPIEGGPQSRGDRHVLVLDKDNHKLYELFDSHLQPDGTSWKVGSAAIFDLSKTLPQRPAGWTSADAAGLPILPGLVRYDEAVERQEIRHALRFTMAKTRHAYVSPATHYASSHREENLPPMGLRVRLKASVDISKLSLEDQVILKALKTYGMFLADNGSDWFITGAPDDRWDNGRLHRLGEIKGSDFEVVKMGTVVTR